MHPFCKLSHEQGYRKVPEMGTPPYIDHPKTPEARGIPLTNAAGNPEPKLLSIHPESE